MRAAAKTSAAGTVIPFIWTVTDSVAVGLLVTALSDLFLQSGCLNGRFSSFISPVNVVWWS